MRSFLVFLALGHASALTIQHQNTARAPNDWSYHGCWTDEGDRQLGGESYASNSMTPDTCISFCESKGYEFAGVEYASECFCGHQIRSKSVKKEEKECDMACSGSSAAVCGGPNRLNIYKSNSAVPITTNPGSAASGWKYLSCYEDSVYARTLRVRVDTSANSVEVCTSACKDAGYKYAGVEWSNECFCDNEIREGRTGGFNDCDMACTGKPTEYCGGSQRLNLYEFSPIVSTTTTTALATSNAPSSTASSSSTTSAILSTTTSSSTTTLSSTTSEPVITTTTTSPIPSSTTTSLLPTTTTTTTAAVITTTASSTTTTTQTTTTTTSQIPLVTNFRLRASTTHPDANNLLIKYNPTTPNWWVNFIAQNVAMVDGVFNIEPTTNRLMAGSFYMASGDFGHILTTNTFPTFAGTPITCAPAQRGQPLKCTSSTGSVQFYIGKAGSNLLWLYLANPPSNLTPVDMIVE